MSSTGKSTSAPSLFVHRRGQPIRRPKENGGRLFAPSSWFVLVLLPICNRGRGRDRARTGAQRLPDIRAGSRAGKLLYPHLYSADDGIRPGYARSVDDDFPHLYERLLCRREIPLVVLLAVHPEAPPIARGHSPAAVAPVSHVPSELWPGLLRLVLRLKDTKAFSSYLFPLC